MNRSDWRDFSKISLGFLLVTFVVLSLLFSRVPGAGGELMSGDAVGAYSRGIESGIVSNWHSSLFIYECIALKKAVMFLLGWNLSGIEVLRLAWYGFSLLMLVSMLCLETRLVRQGWIWGLAFPCCICVSLKLTLADLPVGLDYFFVCLLWLMLAALVEYFSSVSTEKRLVWMTVMLFALIHLVSYRKNSAIIVPVLAACLLYSVPRFKQLSWPKKLTAWLGSVGLFTIVAFTWVDVLLPVKREHPLIPMMESDVRIASILRGEQDVFRKQGFYTSVGHPAEKGMVAYWFISQVAENKWSEYVNLYIKEWLTHPDTMITSALIQRAQFYCGGENWNILKKVVESRYPIVKENPLAWSFVVSLTPPLRRAFWICLSMVSTVVCAILYSKRKIRLPIFVVCVSSGVMAIVYSCSYLLVVPTPDARYLAPSYMFAVVSVLVLVADMLQLIWHRLFQKDELARVPE